MRLSLLIPLCGGVVLFAGLARAVDEDKKDAPAKKQSLKGWELYAQFDTDKKEWRFGLLPGTNRIKTAEEIADATTLEGVRGLQKELSKLAEGEDVLLQNRLPDKVRKEIEDHCTKEKLKFTDFGR